jgi:F-type H+/Na+-transporting ATPase subunit alpha
MPNTKLDIASTFKQALTSVDLSIKTEEKGIISSVGDGIAIIEGLPNALLGEILEFKAGVRGLILNLNVDSVGAIILGEDTLLAQGDVVKRTGLLLSIPVSDKLKGRVVNALGDPLDGQPPVNTKERLPLERIAPGVLERQPVDTPLQTGIKAIDSMIPIGRGQRELIIGDRSTGKSAIALSTIINQKGQGVTCIYVAIGQKQSFVAQTVETLKRFGALDYTIIVSAAASDPASMQYLAPYAGCAIGEFFAQKGQDALIIFDDLSKHAWAYREVSLLLRRPSGREAYPGDVFYLHSRLLERSVRFSKKLGGGSLTALPLIETQAGDVSAYIPTNVISITDGQIFLDADMFNAGQRPAVNLGISVSRVGGSAQIKAMKQVVGSLKIDMAQFRELAAFAQFSSDLDPKTRSQLERGQRITEILKQGWDEPLPVEQQVIIFWAIHKGFIDQVEIPKMKEWESKYLDYMRSNQSSLLTDIKTEKKLSDSIETKLTKANQAFLKNHPELLLETIEA